MDRLDEIEGRWHENAVSHNDLLWLFEQIRNMRMVLQSDEKQTVKLANYLLRTHSDFIAKCEATGIDIAMKLLKEQGECIEKLSKALKDCRGLFFEINNTPVVKTYKLTRKGVQIIDSILITL